MILFFQTKVAVTSFTRRKQCLYGITKFICFTNDSLHPITQSAEIEAKEAGLQEKKKSYCFKVGPANGNNIYDKLQELATRQSYSSHIFVTVTF